MDQDHASATDRHEDTMTPDKESTPASQTEAEWEDNIPVLTEIVKPGDDVAVKGESPDRKNDTVSRSFSELLDEFFESLGYDDDLASLDEMGKLAIERVNESVLATTGKPLLAEQRRRLRRDIEDLLVDWATEYQQQLKRRLCQSFDE